MIRETYINSRRLEEWKSRRLEENRNLNNNKICFTNFTDLLTNALLSVADVYYENHPSYLEEQFQNLVGKVDSINKNCHILAQPAVEKMNAELLEALNSMNT